MKLKLILAAALAAVSVSSAFAQSNEVIAGVYAKLNVGMSAQAGMPSSNGEQGLVSIALGQELTPNFSLEGSLSDFGSRSMPNSPAAVWGSSAAVLAGVFHGPLLGRFDIEGKVGVARTAITGGTNADGTHVNYMGGVGVSYNFDNHWSLGLDYAAYPDFGGSSQTLSTVSLGLKGRF